jgi:AP-1 complex subunit sigma 1/2
MNRAYKRYASLFFITGIESDDNELITLEIVHRYVEVLDRYFGNVVPRLSSCIDSVVGV